LLVCDSEHLIDGSRPSLSQSFDALVEIVKAILGEMFAEVIDPDVDQAFALEVELADLLVFEEAQANFGGEDSLLSR
jgi:hypothetical protein